MITIEREKKTYVLNILIDALCSADKRLLDVCRRLGRRFEEDEVVLLRELRSLVVLHDTFVIQIHFVTNEHDDL